jgi:transposase
MLVLAERGQRVPAIAQELALTEPPVRTWLTRFNDAGRDGLQDRPRAGRPVTYRPAQVAAVMATALTDPRHRHQPLACWTRDRLAPYRTEEQQIAIQRRRLEAGLLAEGLRWRPPATWCGERVAPEVAQTRGAWKHSPLPPLRRGQSCAGSRGGPAPPRVIRASYG